MKKITLFLSLFFACAMLFAQEVHPTRNVIVMIPDGASVSVFSAARWFNQFNGLGHQLNVDPFLTGTVSVFETNAVVAESAAAGSVFSTGIISQAGSIAMHPAASASDIFPVDASRAFQPAATILEAARILQGMATGIVVTCEFTHATPASFAAHHYSRNNRTAIAPQFAFNNLNVLFGGGNSLVSETMRQHLRNNGTTLIQNDRAAMLNYTGNRVWALFGEMALPYDIDRNPDLVPSLAEMTGKAIEILSQHENGFFLMVEGSMVDWAAHANDPVGIITEFLAFDKAVGVAMDFAKRDGNTAVLIMSDHGNSGFSIGTDRCSRFSNFSVADFFAPIAQIRRTANGMAAILARTEPADFHSVFKRYTNIDLTQEEVNSLLASSNFRGGTYLGESNRRNLVQNVVRIYNTHTCFGFTTTGHTGEEILLASFHPQDHILRGHVHGTQVNAYLQQVMGLQTSLQELSDKIFVKHTDVFSGMNATIDRSNPDFPTLTVRNGRNTLQLTAFSSVGVLNGNSFDVGSVVVYMGRNGYFYLPRKLRERL